MEKTYRREVVVFDNNLNFDPLSILLLTVILKSILKHLALPKLLSKVKFTRLYKLKR